MLSQILMFVLKISGTPSPFGMCAGKPWSISIISKNMSSKAYSNKIPTACFRGQTF